VKAHVGGVLAAAAMMLAFCNEDRAGNSGAPKPSATRAAPTPSPADEAKKLAETRCANCHGPAGKGDGPSGATLNPRPRDLTTKEWQKSVSDAQVRSIILKGGPALGKSPLMPANPDLESKSQVVDELVRIVRGYGPP
jgi:mono/diheme cytochrome c family protein